MEKRAIDQYKSTIELLLAVLGGVKQEQLNLKFRLKAAGHPGRLPITS
jgi:hypothetical protein